MRNGCLNRGPTGTVDVRQDGGGEHEAVAAEGGLELAHQGSEAVAVLLLHLVLGAAGERLLDLVPHVAWNQSTSHQPR